MRFLDRVFLPDDATDPLEAAAKQQVVIPGVFPIAPGRWAVTPHTSRTTVAMSLNLLMMCPMWLAEPIVVDQATIEITATPSSAAVFRMGVYAPRPEGQNDTGMPGDLIGTLGEPVTGHTTTGAKTADVPNLQLPAGLVWMAGVGQVVQLTTRGLGQGVLAPMFPQLSPPSGPSLWMTFSTPQISGDLPSTLVGLPLSYALLAPMIAVRRKPE